MCVGGVGGGGGLCKCAFPSWIAYNILSQHHVHPYDTGINNVNMSEGSLNGLIDHAIING